MKTVKMKRKEIKGIDDKGDFHMMLVIIFGLVTILAALGIYRSLKSERTGHCFRWRHIFGFGWFTVMTIIYSGYPTAH